MEAAALTQVASYRRTVAASRVRVWENVFDWEHLPWLHRDSFAAIEGIDAGPWGWRARVRLQPAEAGNESLIELRIDRPNERYVVETLEGLGKGGEIWTQLGGDEAERTDIEVRFLLPDVDPSQADALGKAYVQLYTRLWDEDESMMKRREALLSEPPPRGPGAEPVSLGPLDVVRARLPLLVELAGRPFRVVEVDGDLHVHSTICPHMLGPLEEVPVESGVLRCPWHGYRFDVRTGRSTSGQRLELACAPRVEIDAEDQDVRLVW